MTFRNEVLRLKIISKSKQKIILKNACLIFLFSIENEETRGEMTYECIFRLLIKTFKIYTGTLFKILFSTISIKK